MWGESLPPGSKRFAFSSTPFSGDTPQRPENKKGAPSAHNLFQGETPLPLTLSGFFRLRPGLIRRAEQAKNLGRAAPVVKCPSLTSASRLLRYASARYAAAMPTLTHSPFRARFIHARKGKTRPFWRSPTKTLSKNKTPGTKDAFRKRNRPGLH
jgi:hypothetical protein